jgi:small GTP-binding protein
LNNLKILDLSHNNIKDISIIQGLRKLNILLLGNNKIIDISILKGLSNLKILDLSSNHISDISSIEGLNNLNTLDLSNNKVKELSDAIVEMGLEIAQSRYDLTEGIFLSGNPLEIPPMEIIGKGRKAIKAFLNSLKTGKKLPLNEIKVLLVGGGGVGKTSLVKRLLGQKFEKNEVKTHGININAWKIRKGANEIKVHLWDFGGQEIMHATHQFFLSKRSLYILVLDGRKDEKTEYWLKHIKSFGGDSPVLLTINKIDENPAFDVNRKFLQEKYENIEGFFRISCKTEEGIELFVHTLEKILPQVEILKSTWPFNWFKIKVQLENMTKNFISYKEYLGICTREKVVEKSCQDTLVDYLNDLGVILHFRDFELEDTYVLEPKWVTEAVYKIINSREVAERKGVLNLNMLDKILQKREEEDYYYPRDKYHYIIGLMKKFDLCYGIDDETILIPDLLAVQEPSFDFDYVSALKFIIQYDFLPRSVMPRFIVNMHKDVKNNLQWRTGMVLEDIDFESTAVIRADNDAKRIYIYVNGVQKRDYFAAILATLRRINRSFEKLKTTELIPMPDDPDIIVSYKHLIRLEKEGIEFYLPGDTEKKYRVKDLLGSIGGEIEEDETLQMLKQIQIAQMQRKSGKKNQ